MRHILSKREKYWRGQEWSHEKIYADGAATLKGLLFDLDAHRRRRLRACGIPERMIDAIRADCCLNASASCSARNETSCRAGAAL